MSTPMPFRWKGPGALLIHLADRSVAVPPIGSRSVVSSTDALEAIGAAKIAELVAAGQAELVLPERVQEVARLLAEVERAADLPKGWSR